MSELKFTVEFSGGAENLFGGKKKFDINLPQSSKTWTMKSLLVWIKDNILTGDVDLFLRGETIRPGIIVAINDTDWELLGDLDYVIKERDNIFFISSLHGG